VTTSSEKIPGKGVFIVDDHPIVRQGLCSLLEAQPDLYVCGESDNAGEALRAVETSRPDVMIVDVSLKGTDGLELTKSVRAIDNEIPILIVSMHDEALYAERALRAGANGYVMKQQVSDKVVEAIRQVLRGDIYVSDDIRRRILLGMRGKQTSEEKTPMERLSDRELEVFRLLGNGHTTRRIAEELHLSIKTVETYRAHIKEKLSLDNATELLRYAVQWVEQEQG